MRHSIQAARIGEASHTADGETILEFRFDPSDPVFAGHFPGRPILPGVFQLEMVRVGAEAAMNCRLAVQEISKAKFQRPILPGETVQMALQLSDRDGAIRARATFSVADQPAGETVLLLWRSEPKSGLNELRSPPSPLS